MKATALLLAAPFVCLGAINNVRVTGTTATQAVVGYTAPDGNACTIQVSQNAILSPLIPDVDPTIFAGADSDLSRPGTVANGLARMVVIGQRTSQPATAGQYAGLRHFGRAAQADTPHYGLITSSNTIPSMDCCANRGNAAFCHKDWRLKILVGIEGGIS